VTDADLLAKKLAFIETCVEQLRTLATPARIATDVREERFVEHTLQLAIQATIDVASHIASDRRLGEPATNHELFDLISASGWIDPAQCATMKKMVGFRNTVVHGYLRVNLAIVRSIVEHNLDDLLGYVDAVRAKLRASP